MTEQEFAQLYKFDKDDMATVKPVMQMFKGTIVKTVRRTGEELKKEGMALAENGAGKDWMDAAIGLAERFCKEHPKARFKTEIIREWANGFIAPKSLRVWGPVITAVKKRGIIRAVGWEKVSNPLAHETPATLWEVC